MKMIYYSKYNIFEFNNLNMVLKTAVEAKADYNNISTHDSILNYIGKRNITIQHLKDNFNNLPDLRIALDDLILEGFVDHYDISALRLTNSGRMLLRDGGYTKSKRNQFEVEKLKAEKELLELRNLKLAVRKGSWEFYLMIAGAIGGLISFVILISEFLIKIVNL